MGRVTMEASKPHRTRCRYEITEGVLVIITSEHFSTDDLTQAFESAFVDPHFDPSMNVLLDNRLSRESAPAEEIERRVGLFSSLEGRIGEKCAVVVSDALHYGLARMAAAFSERFDIQVFNDYEQALRWATSEPVDEL